MARNENPPFGRGETFYNLFSATTQSTSDGQQFEGKEWVFEDILPTTKLYRSPQYVTCRVVRNVSNVAGTGLALLPSRVVKFAYPGGGAANNTFGPVMGGQIDGYVFNTPASAANNQNSRGFPLDEFLPTAGLQINDLGWIVVKGPANVLTDLAALSPGIVVGDLVIAQTAATSQATTAGRVIDIAANIANATVQVANALAYLGYAISGPAIVASSTNSSTAVTAGAANSSVLVDVIYH